MSLHIDGIVLFQAFPDRSLSMKWLKVSAIRYAFRKTPKNTNWDGGNLCKKYQIVSYIHSKPPEAQPVRSFQIASALHNSDEHTVCFLLQPTLLVRVLILEWGIASIWCAKCAMIVMCRAQIRLRRRLLMQRDRVIVVVKWLQFLYIVHTQYVSCIFASVSFSQFQHLLKTCFSYGYLVYARLASADTVFINCIKQCSFEVFVKQLWYLKCYTHWTKTYDVKTKKFSKTMNHF